MKIFLILILCITGIFTLNVRKGSPLNYNEGRNFTNFTFPSENVALWVAKSFLSISQTTSTRFLRSDTHPILGDYLVDDRNMSLYILDKEFSENTRNLTDLRNITIYCLSDCKIKWPPLLIHRENLTEPFGWDAGHNIENELMGYIIRPEGMLRTNFQLTYNNIPLYYYSLDTKSGDINGHLLTDEWGTWHLMRPDGTPIIR